MDYLVSTDSLSSLSRPHFVIIRFRVSNLIIIRGRCGNCTPLSYFIVSVPTEVYSSDEEIVHRINI